MNKTKRKDFIYFIQFNFVTDDDYYIEYPKGKPIYGHSIDVKKTFKGTEIKEVLEFMDDMASAVKTNNPLKAYIQYDLSLLINELKVEFTKAVNGELVNDIVTKDYFGNYSGTAFTFIIIDSDTGKASLKKDIEREEGYIKELEESLAIKKNDFMRIFGDEE